jgi:hypothetical protein
MSGEAGDRKVACGGSTRGEAGLRRQVVERRRTRMQPAESAPVECQATRTATKAASRAPARDEASAEDASVESPLALTCARRKAVHQRGGSSKQAIGKRCGACPVDRASSLRTRGAGSCEVPSCRKAAASPQRPAMKRVSAWLIAVADTETGCCDGCCGERLRIREHGL